jgi:hypothetical protein
MIAMPVSDNCHADEIPHVRGDTVHQPEPQQRNGHVGAAICGIDPAGGRWMEVSSHANAARLNAPGGRSQPD